jgi:hypothetical protein
MWDYNMLFETSTEFSHYIESLADDKEIGLVDTILMYCENNFIEPEDISSLINRSLKEKLEMEFQELKYLPRTSTLEF